MRGALAAAFLTLLASCAGEGGQPPPLSGRIVDYGRSATGASLRGVLYLPEGKGPFPVLLYAHGSAPGEWSNAAFEAIVPHFARRGWAMFAPYRHGQGLSGEAGPYIGDEISAARRTGDARNAQLRLTGLLASDHMADQAQAFTWLSRQAFTDPRRVATMGNSFGGVIALLSAGRLPVCAAVDAAGGAESWDKAPALRALMTRAAQRARAPVLFVQAENDFDLAPSRALHVAMRNAGKPAEIRLYPSFGRSARDGHAFAYKGAAIWADDVLTFLGRACPTRNASSALEK